MHSELNSKMFLSNNRCLPVLYSFYDKHPPLWTPIKTQRVDANSKIGDQDEKAGYSSWGMPVFLSYFYNVPGAGSIW